MAETKNPGFEFYRFSADPPEGAYHADGLLCFSYAHRASAVLKNIFCVLIIFLIPAVFAMNANAAPLFIEAKWELPDDDGFTDGTQVYPIPKGSKTITICAIACDNISYNNIDKVTGAVHYPDGTVKDEKELTPASNGTICWNTIPDWDYAHFTGKHDNGTCTIYEVNFTMNYTDTSGVYAVYVEVNNTNGEKGNITNNFTYMQLVGIESDVSLIQFPAADPGQSSNVSGDNIMGTSRPTVMNIGNVLVDISANATKLVCMSAGCIGFTLPEPATGFNETEYSLLMDGTIYGSTDYPAPSLPIPPGGTNMENFKLQIPLATPPGNYMGTVLLKGVIHI